MWSDLPPCARRRKKKYLDQTPLMKRNLLTLKSTILVVRIVINDEFISLRRNPTSPSLFSIKKEQKKKERKIEFSTKIDEFLKMRGDDYLIAKKDGD
jgi:hypothetical protein